MAEKSSRKDLKQPDEFVSFTQRAVQWAIAQRAVLIGGFVAIAVVVIAAYGWRWYAESKEKAASRDLMQAKKILEARVVEKAEADLTTPIDGTFASEQDKWRAAIAEFEKVIQSHPGTPTASLATYFIGEYSRLLGEYDKAIEQFKEYLKREGPQGELAPFAIEGIGTTLEAQGKIPEAREQFRRLTEAPYEGETDRGLYHLARLEQKNGDPKEAARQFKEILEKYPKTIFQREIQDRLATLPELPAPTATNPTHSPGPAPEAGGK